MSFKKGFKVKYNNNIYQVIIRSDNQKGFLKIVFDGEKYKYEIPSAKEFLHLSSMLNTSNRIKF